MLELKLLLFTQGLRFLLFDYKSFSSLRELLSYYPFFNQLLRCSFCQGFWCGFFVFLFPCGFFDAIMWGLGSAIISITWFALVIPKIDAMEDEKHEKKLTE